MELARYLVMKFCYSQWMGRLYTNTLSRGWGSLGTRLIATSHYNNKSVTFSSLGLLTPACTRMGRRKYPQRTLLLKSDWCQCYTRTFCVSGQNRECWSCHSTVSQAEFFCPFCNSLQPPDESKDYFQILDCDKSFDVNIQVIQKTYRKLQQSLHPDYFSKKSQVEQDLSKKQSSLVSEAYNTLLSPLQRGIYLLSLYGILFEEGMDSGVDPQFLLEILDISEQLSERDTSTEIEDIGNFVQDMYDTLTDDVRNAFQEGDLHGAKLLLAKMKYFSTIQEQVKKKMIQ
ncbi:iron-sulfur cluster co-chaperone protein HscB [Pelodytes ibericus]